MAFSLVAYARVRRILLTTAAARLQSAGTVVALLLEQSVNQDRIRLAGVGADPALSRFLTTRRDTAAARQAMVRAWVGSQLTSGRIELRDASGAVVLDTTRGNPPTSARWIERMVAGHQVTAPTMGPLYAVGDSMYGDAMVPVPPGGYLATSSRLTASGAQTIRDLIGPHAAMLIGVPGEPQWTDLEHNAAAPAGAVPGKTMVSAAGVGATIAIRGSQWVLWVEQPADVVLAPMQRLMAEIAVMAVLFIVLGTGVAWALSRQITQPIVALTGAAERVARAESLPPAPANVAAEDEITRLTNAFERMSRRVEESRQELELQVDEAQSLAEELEVANDDLRVALVAADEARDAAQTANRVKSDFLAVMSHELRTPLNAIIGYGELLRAGLCGPLTADQEEKLARMRRSADELLRLVNQVLDLERMGAGKEHVFAEPTEVGDLVRATVAEVELQAAERGLRLIVDPPDPPVTVVADVAKLRQILLNLLSNAVKYTEHGEIRISVRPANSALQFVVQDTGIGIHPDHRLRIFEPFWQADQRLTRRVGGTGLGLTIAQRLTQMLGGEISVESTLGQGSTFTVDLPLAPQQGAAA